MDSNREVEITEYLQDASAKIVDLNSIREKASKAIERSQSYNLKYFNDHHKTAKTFEEGDLVVLRIVDTTAGVNKKYHIYKMAYSGWSLKMKIDVWNAT